MKSLFSRCAAFALALVVVVAGADIASAKKGGKGYGKGWNHGVNYGKAHWKRGYAWHPPGWSKGRKRG